MSVILTIFTRGKTEVHTCQSLDQAQRMVDDIRAFKDKKASFRVISRSGSTGKKKKDDDERKRW